MAQAYRQAFRAAVAATETLYRPAADGAGSFPFLAVERAALPTEEFALAGVALSRIAGGAWSTAVSLEGSAAGFGLPRSGFARPVVTAGSEEAAAIATMLASARGITEGVRRAGREGGGTEAGRRRP